MNRRILMSGISLFGAAAVIAGATFAFFSDTETSTDNVFAAGSLDLQIDNESYYNGQVSTATSWNLKDLTIEKFFNFTDVKPNDHGEDTISLHVIDNDAWLCADVTLTEDDDETCTSSEQIDDPTCGESNADLTDGDLADSLNFIWWADDGDNVLEVGETVLPGGPLGAINVGDSATVALADSTTNIWTGGPDTPVVGEDTVYLAKAWCFGDITPEPLEQNEAGPESTRTPANSTGGVSCNGINENNAAQTDKVMADVSFRAVQARNNDAFVCEPPVVEPTLTPTPTGTS